MCGICGFTKENILASDKGLIKRMNDLLWHRGPDEEGYFYDKNIALGHRRLSIIDLKKGKQPMETERYVIVFNGEIYNFQDLRRGLKKRGYSFKTDSDTEVLLKMYEAYQEKCIDYLEGMFAFAVWDKKKKELFIARDRLGVKPLYYTILNKEIIFASEIKSILICPGFKKRLNIKVLNSYFQYRYIVGNETFFEGIYGLLAGHFLKFKQEEKSLIIKEYWHLPLIAEKKDRGEDYYIQKTRELILKSVEKRMISDVPLGAYLSGGLDSSIIVSAMANLKKREPIQTFTIGFKEEGFNEFKYATLVAEKLKTKHHEILLEAKDYFREMENLIRYKDAPLAVPNEVPLYLMSKELKKYITVVLSGEGADELFAGYGRIFRSYLEFKNNGRYLDFFLEKYNYVSDNDLAKFFSSDILDEINKEKYSYSVFRDYFNKIEKLETEDKALYIFQNIHLQGLLQRVDMTTMAASVEGRVPFVDDHNLIEFTNEIPFNYKIKWKSQQAEKKAIKEKLKAEEISENLDIPKYLLKKAFEDFLPKAILERKKIGFPVPLDNWFKGRFQNYAKNILLDRKTTERGIFNKEYLGSGEFLRDLSGINIWMMINLELFLRKYFD